MGVPMRVRMRGTKAMMMRSSIRGLLAGATWAALSCADPTPLVQNSPGDRLEASLVGPHVAGIGFLHCAPLAYDSVTRVIGPKGGTIHVGPHKLSIPRRALTGKVSITAVASSDTVNRVRFEPTGLTFLRNASLTMSYANCDLLGLLTPKRIAHVSDALDVLDYLVSVDDPKGRKVTGQLPHFSQYAVAW